MSHNHVSLALCLRNDDLPGSGFHPPSDFPDVVTQHIRTYNWIRDDSEKADPRLAAPAVLFIRIQNPPPHPEAAKDIDADFVLFVQNRSAATQLDRGRRNEPK